MIIQIVQKLQHSHYWRLPWPLLYGGQLLHTLTPMRNSTKFYKLQETENSLYQFLDE